VPVESAGNTPGRGSKKTYALMCQADDKNVRKKDIKIPARGSTYFRKTCWEKRKKPGRKGGSGKSGKVGVRKGGVIPSRDHLFQLSSRYIFGSKLKRGDGALKKLERAPCGAVETIREIAGTKSQEGGILRISRALEVLRPISRRLRKFLESPHWEKMDLQSSWNEKQRIQRKE